MRKSLLALSLLAATSAPVLAADYSDGDIHKNDYKWMQFNLMGAFDELPGKSSHDYLEMEFGGRSGIFDLYGYVDVFNLATNKSSDKVGDPKIFMKFAPRMSLDAFTGVDMSFGPVQEVYVASLFEWDGTDFKTNAFSVNNQKIGLGSDVMVPWFGKVGLNLYGTYDGNRKIGTASKSRPTGLNLSISSRTVHSSLTKVISITNSALKMNTRQPATAVRCLTVSTGIQIVSL